MENFTLAAVGVAVLLVALGLLWVFRQLNRTLVALEELLTTTNDEIKETLPEVRGSLANMNDITATVNLGLRATESGLDRARAAVVSAGRGVSAGVRSFLRPKRRWASSTEAKIEAAAATTGGRTSEQ